MKVNISGAWKSGIPWVNVGGAWKKGVATWVNINGTWKKMAYEIKKIIFTADIVKDTNLGSTYRWRTADEYKFTKDPSDYVVNRLQVLVSKNKYSSTPSSAFMIFYFTDKAECARITNLYNAGKLKVVCKGGFEYTYTKSNSTIMASTDLIQVRPNDKGIFYNMLNSVVGKKLTITIDLT